MRAMFAVCTRRAASPAKPLTSGASAGAFLLWAVLSASACWAKSSALLVGVSGYPRLAKDLRISGPKNDVELVGKTLIDLGFAADSIVTLADGAASSSGDPTRTAILEALDRLAQQASHGDRVVLFFAGHGARQPADPKTIGTTSVDGFEAIFLPFDAARWHQPIQAVPNAINNHTLKNKVDAIRARGAFVYVIFDSCHSQYMVRGLAASTRQRGVSLDDLGIPKNVVAAVSRRTTRGAGSIPRKSNFDLGGTAALAGGYVGFFAAQSTETTIELPQPEGAVKPVQHGLFTFTLIRALTMNPAASFERIGDQILKLYAEHGRAASTPSFVGTALGESISGAPPADTSRQFRIASDYDGSLSIPAGKLHNIGDGSIFAVLPSALATTDQAQSYVGARKPGVDRTQVVPVEHNGLPASSAANLHNTIARLVVPVVSMTLRVALPSKVKKPSAKQNKAQNTLEQLVSTGAAQSNIVWVSPEIADVDVRMVMDSDVLWLLPGADSPGDLTHRAPSIPLGSKQLAQSIQMRFGEISKALNLIRVASELQGGGPPGFSVRVRLAACGAAPEAARELALTEVPSVTDGDQLLLDLKNTGPQAVDVTVLYLDSEYSLSGIAPNLKRDESNRLAPLTGKGTLGVYARNMADGRISTLGVERVIVIATGATPKQPESNFLFLASRTLAPTRGIRTSLESLLASAGFAQNQTRGSQPVPAHDIASSFMRVISWNVLAPTASEQKQ